MARFSDPFFVEAVFMPLIMAVMFGVIGLLLNALEAWGGWSLQSLKRFPDAFVESFKDSRPAYMALLALAVLAEAAVLGWWFRDEISASYPRWYVVPIAAGVIAVSSLAIFRASPITSVQDARRRMRWVGVAIKFSGLAIVGYELNWIIALGLFVTLWGNNISTRLNVVAELIEQKLIKEEHT